MPKCVYCRDEGFYGDVFTGGECYCLCPKGVALKRKEDQPPPAPKPRPTAWDRVRDEEL